MSYSASCKVRARKADWSWFMGGPHMQDDWGLQVVKVATQELVALDVAIRKAVA